APPRGARPPPSGPPRHAEEPFPRPAAPPPPPRRGGAGGARGGAHVTPPTPARRSLGRVPYKWIVAAVFVCGMFMDILDTTIVNVALPTLQREFHTTTASVEWVVLGYLLSLAVWIPASGWIGDRIGTKKVFVTALAMFTIASAL